MKALRLMNRRLCSIASERIFENITISTTDASFIQLLNVASSELWSKQVRYVEWILLNESGRQPGILQGISFKEIDSYPPRFKNLRLSTVPTVHGLTSFVGLDLQCQLMRMMSNVQTIRFRSGLKCHREGREPWQDHIVRSDQVKVNNFAAEKLGAPGWSTRTVNGEPMLVSASDVFSLLRHSRLKPSLVETIAATMRLGYSADKELEHVHLMSILEDPARNHIIAEDSVTFVPRKYQEEYKEYRAEMEFFSHELNCFRSLVHSEVSSLKTLKVCGIWIFARDLERLVVGNRRLELLHIGNVELSVSLEELEAESIIELEPIPTLLSRLRHHYSEGRLHDLRVAFEDTRIRFSSGDFSATEREVQRWMEGENDELIETARNAFWHVTDEEESEDEVSLGRQADESEDDYEYDTEEETTEMMCRESIRQYCAELNGER